MRRGRNLREYREHVLKERAKTISNPKPVRRINVFRERLKKRAQEAKIKSNAVNLPSYNPLPKFDFKKYDEYIPTFQKPVVICHLIESVGLGGAQTMMLELINGLNKYYGGHSKNICVHLGRKDVHKNIYETYNVDPIWVRPSDFKNFCKSNYVDVVVQHRIAISKCLKSSLPSNVKYVLVNHTWHNMSRMTDFIQCDAYVSVCQFLHDRTLFPEFINTSRRFVILNGVENKYIVDIEPSNLEGNFRTGRCHRMVPSKFSVDSLQWMKNTVFKEIPGFTHHIIGSHSEVKALTKKHSYLKYYGSITDRYKKMSIIKSLDVYFYETFQDEGASIAILESLACGVPVLCKKLGGCPELIKNGFNGFVVKDRHEYLLRFLQLKNPNYLNQIKNQVLADFDSRLHIRHSACKYMQLIEVLNESTSNNR